MTNIVYDPQQNRVVLQSGLIGFSIKEQDCWVTCKRPHQKGGAIDYL
jgi:hypothetical protein